jgi:hypothetical protein
MRIDVIARLAAANPVPSELSASTPRRRRRRRFATAAVAAIAIAIPAAIAVADQIGVSNRGSAVPRSSAPLDEVLQEMNVGPTVQYLGALNGVAFYAGRDADGHFCLAIDHVNEQYDKGAGCDLRADGFPSAGVRALTFPPARQLQGIASDGVAIVEALDPAGTVLDSTPVVQNLFASDKDLGGAAVYIQTLDANGNVLSKQKLPGR